MARKTQGRTTLGRLLEKEGIDKQDLKTPSGRRKRIDTKIKTLRKKAKTRVAISSSAYK